MAIAAGAGIAAVGGLASSAVSGRAARDAARSQQDAVNAQIAYQERTQRPWMEAGQFALGQLQQGLSPGGQFTGQFTMADAQNSAAEQHALQQGTQAIQNSAAAKGGLLNSNTLQDLVEYGQANAAQYQNQAFNQYLAQRNANLAPLQSLAGLGQTSTQHVADNVSNLALSGAAAGAAGRVGQANAVSSGIENVGNQISMLAGLFGRGGSGGTSLSIDPQGYGIDPYGYLGGASTAGDYSDERMKENVKRVGSTDDGLPIYTYRMKGGGPTKMGVMAQDMQHARPGSVTADNHGMLMVDYGKV